MNIIHISDMHTGDCGYESDVSITGFSNSSDNKKKMLDQGIADIKLHFKEILRENQIDLVIFSGDLSFKADQSEYKNIKSIIDFFYKKKIPILITAGNHDVNWNSTLEGKENEKFVNFQNFMQKYCRNNPVKYINKKEISYFINYNEKLIFIGLNSSKYIDHDNKNRAIIDLKDLDYVENHFEKKKDLKTIWRLFPKILITHHDWSYLKKTSSLGQHLLERNFKIIFSGHIHGYSCNKCDEYEIINVCSGSILSKNEDRMLGTLDSHVTPRQYNNYFISEQNDFYQINGRIYKKEECWNFEEKEIYEFDFTKKTRFNTLPRQIKIFFISNISAFEKNQNISIGENDFNIDYLAYDKEGNERYIFYIDSKTSDQKIQIINQIYFSIETEFKNKIILLIFEREEIKGIKIPQNQLIFLENE